MKKKEYYILQLKSVRDADVAGNKELECAVADELFLSQKELHRRGKEPNGAHYKTVYRGALPDLEDDRMALLETLYTRFNIDHPADFTGHSLSVSDIVAIKETGKTRYYFCDSIGFNELEGFVYDLSRY